MDKRKWVTGPSRIHGHGVIVTERIEKDELIGVSHNGYPYEITMLELGNYNHSSKPTAYSVLDVNAKCRKIFALDSLEPGDEITLNFRDAPELEQPQKGRVWPAKAAFREDLTTLYAFLGMLMR